MPDRVGLTRAIEELYTFSPLINRTRRRDIGEFTTRKPETVTRSSSRRRKAELHDGLLDVIARILAFCHGQQNVKFMMTTIRRQAASCLYGLAPLLQDILAGKLDRLEVMEASDGDADGDLGFVDGVRADIAATPGTSCQPRSVRSEGRGLRPGPRRTRAGWPTTRRWCSAPSATRWPIWPSACTAHRICATG